MGAGAPDDTGKSGSATQAGDPDHSLEGAQLLDDAGQVDAIVHADDQLDHADAAVALVHADLLDVAVGRVDAGGEQGDQATLVLQLDAQFDIEFAGDILGPAELDAFSGCGVLR